MVKKFLIAVFVLLYFGADAQKIVGYLPSYRDPAPDKIQYSKLHTIIYAFINPNAQGQLITTTGNGAAWDFNMNHFNTVKTHCNTYGVKLSISLGGADAGGLRSARLNSVSANNTARTTLVNQLVTFAITHQLDGIDVDWEFPKTTEEVDNHLKLLEDLSAAIANSSKPSLRLGVAVGGEYTGTIHHLNYFSNAAVQYVDDFHIMAYDFPATYHDNHASLYDAQQSFNTWNSQKGVPKNKMYLGVPFYARNQSRSAESEYNVFSAGAASHNIDLYNGWYYNGKSTLEAKAEWVVQQGGQGIMIWDLGQDRTDAYSLLNVIHEKMNSICAAPQPDLGQDITFCSGTSILLQSGQGVQNGRTFTWRRNGSVLVNASPNQTTYNATEAGTYEVEISQNGCSKTDLVVLTVRSGSVLNTDPATRCGAGEVTLRVTSTGGVYDWYDVPVGGTKLYTGSNYTFNAANSKTYYVEDNTGLNSYSAGKPAITLENPWPWNESANSDNALPKFAHKIVIHQPLVLEQLKVWTSNHTITGARIKVISATDGTTVLQQTDAFTLPSGNSPHTISPQLQLESGTYYIGIYAPVSGGGGNPGIWLEPNNNFPSSESGVFSMEGRVYVSYSAGFNADPSPTPHYGQLFDWVFGKPTCGRTPVSVTIETGANTQLTVNNAAAVCPNQNATFTIAGSETGVSYQPYIGGTAAGTAVNGNGGTISLTVLATSLQTGSNTVTVRATKTGCATVSLANTSTVQVNTTAPSVSLGNIQKVYGDPVFNLAATSNSAGTFSYSLESSTPASIVSVQANGQVTISGAGTAQIKVTQAADACYSAGEASATLTIQKATRTVAVTSGANATVNTPLTLTYSATPASSNASWSSTNQTGSATLAGVVLTPLSTGTVQVTVTVAEDNNYLSASASETITILHNQTPQPGDFTAYTNPVTQGQTGVEYTIPSAPGTTYSWTYSGNGATISGTGNSILIDFSSGATSGTLSVIADDGSGPSIPRTLEIEVSPLTNVWVSSTLETVRLSAQPNPLDENAQFLIELPIPATTTLEVLSIYGQTVATLFSSQELSAGEHTVAAPSLPSGLYLLRLKAGNTEKTIKIIR